MSTLGVLIFVFNLSHAQRTLRTNDRVAPLPSEAAKERWQEFFNSRQSENYFFEFDLVHIPRKSESTTYKGFLLGKYFDGNYHTRLILSDEKSNEDFLMIYSNRGEHKVYKFDKEINAPRLLEKSEWTNSFIKELISSPFEVFMPYKSWESFYTGAGRIGQAVYFYTLKSPSEDLPNVRIALSREFNHPVQSEFLKENIAQKTVSLSSVKKVGDYWIMKDVEIKDNISKDKDKMIVVAANLEDILDKKLFTPENLGKAIEQKPVLERID